MSSTFDLHQPAEGSMDQLSDQVVAAIDEVVDEPIDGRTARAIRTREAIVDACIELVDAGELRPTAPRIAERASVSVRSVFQHFDDLETLYTAVGARVVERVALLTRSIDPTTPLHARSAEFVRQRCAINEALSPMLRAAVVHAPGSSTINRQFQTGHDWVCGMVAEVFGPELAQIGSDRESAYNALVVAGSWSTWNLLRSLEHRSEAEAEVAVAGLIDLVWRSAAIAPSPTAPLAQDGAEARP